MESTRTRATELLPSVLLTVLSMIQALALELAWTRLRDSPFLWEGGWDAAIGWGQMGVVVLGMTVVWLLYVSLVLRFTWLPTVRDSIVPFGIGILEFTLIELSDPASLALWFYALALIFAVSVWSSHVIIESARGHAANREFFETEGPSGYGFRDFAAPLAVAGGLAIVAVILQVSGTRGWFAFCGLLLASVALLFQIALIRRYWTLHLVESPPTEGDESQE